MLKGNFDTNYFELLIILSSLQKAEFLKLIVLFLHYFWHQIRDQWLKLSGKNTQIFFSTFGSKINKFGRKKSEKNEKIPKEPKSCRQLP